MSSIVGGKRCWYNTLNHLQTQGFCTSTRQTRSHHHVTTSPRTACVESRRLKYFWEPQTIFKRAICVLHTVGYQLLGDDMKNVLHNKTKKKRKRSPSFIWEALIIFTLLRSTMPRFCSHFGTNSPQIVMLINPHIFYAVRKKTLNLGMNSKRQIYGRRHYCEMWSFKNLTRLSLCG